MGSIKQGILGAFSGKVGTVIGYTLRGVAYMRGLATGFTDANTQAQQDQRAKFKLAVKFLRPLVALLHISFKHASEKMSGFAAAMSYTLENAITGVSPLFAIDYTKILVSMGNLPGALNAGAVSVEAGVIDISWDDNSWDFGAKATDKVVLVAYCEALGKSVSVIGAASRITGVQSIELPELFQGNAVQVWIGFTNDADFSDGEWLAEVNVL
jgi:hypothetical protein